MKITIALIFAAFLTGCGTITSNPMSFTFTGSSSGRLDFGFAGCMLRNAKYTNLSSNSQGYQYHQVNVYGVNKNTLATYTVNCQPTMAGGTGSCPVIRGDTLSGEAGLACVNFHTTTVTKRGT